VDRRPARPKPSYPAFLIARTVNASWSRLIHKVYGADPMICRQCGSKLRLIAFITDSLSIQQVLEPLGLWSDEHERPPPEPRELRVVPVDEAGREIGEAW